MGPTPPRQRAGPRVAAVVEDVAWELGVSRATLYRLIELYKTFGTVDVLQPSATGRWPEPNEMWDACRHTWLLNVLVPGFDDMVHRFGAKTVMSRRPFLPIAFRCSPVSQLRCVIQLRRSRVCAPAPAPIATSASPKSRPSSGRDPQIQSHIDSKLETGTCFSLKPKCPTSRKVAESHAKMPSDTECSIFQEHDLCRNSRARGF
jgi:hypothetical protein